MKRKKQKHAWLDCWRKERLQTEKARALLNRLSEMNIAPDLPDEQKSRLRRQFLSEPQLRELAEIFDLPPLYLLKGTARTALDPKELLKLCQRLRDAAADYGKMALQTLQQREMAKKKVKALRRRITHSFATPNTRFELRAAKNRLGMQEKRVNQLDTRFNNTTYEWVILRYLYQAVLLAYIWSWVVYYEQEERKILTRLVNTKAVGEDPDAIWGRKAELEDTLGRRRLLDPLRVKLPGWRW